MTNRLYDWLIDWLIDQWLIDIGDWLNQINGWMKGLIGGFIDPVKWVDLLIDWWQVMKIWMDNSQIMYTAYKWRPPWMLKMSLLIDDLFN